MVRRVGKIIEFSMWSDKNIPASQEIGSLSINYRPVINTYPNRIYLKNSINTTDDITIVVEDDGTIRNGSNANHGNWVVIHGIWTSYTLPTK